MPEKYITYQLPKNVRFIYASPQNNVHFFIPLCGEDIYFGINWTVPPQLASL